MRRRAQGFTLIELLIVVAIIALLASLILLGWPAMKNATQRSVSLNNLRALGVAARLYSSDHDDSLPGRIQTSDKWPKLFSNYLDDVKVYAATGDTNNFIMKHLDPLANNRNNTSYIINGFNDVGELNDETIAIKFVQINNSSDTILFGTPKSGSTHFYMDFEGPHGGDQVNVLNLELYDHGSNYLFVDGSARFILKTDYDPKMWLVNRDYVLP